MARSAGRFTSEASRSSGSGSGFNDVQLAWGVDVLPSIGDLRTGPLSHTGKNLSFQP